jgi:hypothetical protein
LADRSVRRIGSIMGSKKSRKQKKSFKASKPGRRKFSLTLLICICAAIVGAGGWLFYNKSGMRTEPKPEDSNAQNFKKDAVQTVSPDKFQNLIGRWIRPDGGYIIEIRNVGSDGLMEAAYFNPRPIHVSQARLTSVNKELQVFIELRDVGYPGATYALIYHPEQDVMAGLYYQPTAGQSFEVIFVRMNP